MDYKKLYKDTITKLQEMVNSGEITVETACGICADFVPESKDERIRKELISFVRGMIACHDKPNAERDEKYESWVAWLEKQGEQEKDILEDAILDGNEDGLIAETIRYKNEKQGEQKPAWSEEDKKLWVHDDDIFLDAAKMIVEDSPRKSYGGVHKKEIVPWFYSLKERLKSLRPQSQWKPSDEQMNTLEYYMHTLVCNEHKEILFGLYADLKKLREK